MMNLKKIVQKYSETGGTLSLKNYQNFRKKLFFGIFMYYHEKHQIKSFSVVFGCTCTTGPMACTTGPMQIIIGPVVKIQFRMILNAILAGASCLLLGACRMINSYPVFVVGRVLIGISCGISSTVAPIYLAEIAPKNKKGLFGSSFNLGITIGIVVAQIFGLEWVFGTNDSWPINLALGAAPAVSQVLLGIFSPESPAWLAGQGDMGKGL